VTGDFTFTGFDEAAAKAAAPPAESIRLAEQLFSSPAAAQQAVHNIAGLVIQRLPGKGHEWMAECAGEIPGILTGHIDLLTSDLEHLVDIKTTGQMPENGKMKPEHLWQLVAYALLVLHHTGKPPHYAHILYVDRHGDWVCRSKALDFYDVSGQALLRELYHWLEVTKNNAYAPTPVFGPHCDGAWCPYRQICRDASVPGAAAVVRRHEPVAVSSNPFTGP
jgi:CRISPR/Cas system-associated exonuclease Cas4 (RecB family)